ncbi:helix-turn-helix domain-containing protein [Phormidesmis sp. 146-33]
MGIESKANYQGQYAEFSVEAELQVFLNCLFEALGSTSFSLKVLKLLAQHDQTWTEEQQSYYVDLLKRNHQRFPHNSAEHFRFNCSSDSPTSITESSCETILLPVIPELQEVFDFIDTNYHRAISLADVAQITNYSPAYLTKTVGAKTGCTVNAWIVKRRLFEAQKLLKQTKQTIEEISQKVGYSNVNHFFRQFRQSYGITPSQWRNRAENLS